MNRCQKEQACVSATKVYLHGNKVTLFPLHFPLFSRNGVTIHIVLINFHHSYESRILFRFI